MLIIITIVPSVHVDLAKLFVPVWNNDWVCKINIVIIVVTYQLNPLEMCLHWYVNWWRGDCLSLFWLLPDKTSSPLPSSSWHSSFAVNTDIWSELLKSNWSWQQELTPWHEFPKPLTSWPIHPELQNFIFLQRVNLQSKFYTKKVTEVAPKLNKIEIKDYLCGEQLL